MNTQPTLKHKCVQVSDNFHILYVQQFFLGCIAYWCKVRDLPYNHWDTIRVTAKLDDVEFVDRRKRKYSFLK